MRRLAAACVLTLSVTVPVAGVDHQKRLREADDRAAVAAHARLQPAANALAEMSGHYWLIIPISGNAQGSFGTSYKTDVMISNHRNVNQLVEITFCPAGEDCVTGPEQLVTVPANGVLSLDDIVGKTFNRTGIGALDLFAVTADDGFDFDAKIDAVSRIWTPMANTNGTPFAGGTSSQSLPAVVANAVTGPEPAYILGLRQDANFRSNIGIWNHDLFDAHTFTVTIVPANGERSTFTVHVPAWTVVQTAFPAGNFGSFMAIVTPPAEFNDWWVSYASSNDNTTGDGWVSVGSQND